MRRPTARPPAAPARAQAARVEAERLERHRHGEVERAERAWAAVERAYAEDVASQQGAQQQAVVVPARRAEPVEVLADRPPREAEGPAGRSLFEVG